MAIVFDILFAEADRLSPPAYAQFLEPIDVISGLVKAAVFGFIIAAIGCFEGLQVRVAGEARGTVTEVLQSAPYLSIVPQGGTPLPVPWTACFWVKRADAADVSAALIADFPGR